MASGTTTVEVDLTTDLQAVATFTDGSVQNVTADSWVSGNNGIATVSGSVVTGVAPGQAAITASFAGKSGSLLLTVLAAPPSALTVSSGTYSFNTDTGVLPPSRAQTYRVWLEQAQKRLQVDSFTLGAGVRDSDFRPQVARRDHRGGLQSPQTATRRSGSMRNDSSRGFEALAYRQR